MSTATAESLIKVEDITFDQARRSGEMLARAVEHVLIKGEDYGYSNGLAEPFLKKSGAEKLCSWFLLRANPIHQKSHENWPAGQFGYRYLCELSYKGEIIGGCEGFCTNLEDEFAFEWIEAPPPASAEEAKLATMEFRGRMRKQFGEWVWMEKIKVDNPYEKINLVMKRAQKRALVGAVLLVFAASGYFSRTQIEGAVMFDGD